MRFATRRLIRAVTLLASVLFVSEAHASFKIMNKAARKAFKAGQFTECGKLFERAAELANNDKARATVLSNASACWRKTTDHAAASRTAGRAGELLEKIGDKKRAARAYNKAAAAMVRGDDIQGAMKWYEKSLALAKRSGSKARVSIVHYNIGEVWFAEARYDKARQSYQRAVDVAKEANSAPALINALPGLAKVYAALNQPKKALALRERAVAESRKNKDRGVYLSKVLLPLGRSYHARGQLQRALDTYNEALRVLRADANPPNPRGAKATEVAIISAKASALSRAGKFEKALKLRKNAYEVRKSLKNKTKTAEAALGLALAYHRLGRSQEGLPLAKEAYTTAKRNQVSELLRQAAGDVGALLHGAGKSQEAVAYLEEAIELSEKLRKTAKGHERTALFEKLLYLYTNLTDVFVTLGRAKDALHVVEKSRAKSLAEQLGLSGADAASVDDIQSILPPKTALIAYANMSKSKKVGIVVTKKTIEAEHLDVDAFYATARPLVGNGKSGGQADQRGIRIKRRPRPNDEVPTKGKKRYLDDIIADYRAGLVADKSPAKKKGSPLPDNVAGMSKALHTFLIKPFSKQLKGKKKLLILTDGVLALLPFETLSKKRLLVQTHEIAYIPSISVFRLLKNRKFGKRKPLLAFGGATYEPVQVDAPLVTNPAQIDALAQRIKHRIAAKKSLRRAYARLGVQGWTPLPGSKSEVQAIKKIVKGAKVRSGADVSETTLKALSSKGKLKEFAVLHFATHGVVLPSNPELSALVLSQFASEKNSEDGYLIASEIAEMNLAADFVNLSACETGLGKIYGGEGVVGVSQAFLQAGSNALSVSLWKVADESTALFMKELYRRVYKKKMSFSAAMTATKRAFLSGKHGAKNRAPYRWAPFVYSGNP